MMLSLISFYIANALEATFLSSLHDIMEGGKGVSPQRQNDINFSSPLRNVTRAGKDIE